jgi:SAM-dependent methyltransferase
MEKVILDCGAGGEYPTLSLFYQYGYQTYGVEIMQEALNKAQAFCQETGMQLRILGGDMRRIPFASQSFSFVYAFNSIFFMTKPDIARSIQEIERVLRPGGLCYVNFVSVDDPDREPFCETAFARRLFGSERFAHHRDNEADEFFERFQITRKEKRLVQKVVGRKQYKQAYIEYIARKT